MIDVLLTVPGNTPPEKIDQLAKDYDLRVYRVCRISGDRIVVMCLVSVINLFYMSRERQKFVLTCEPNEEFETMVRMPARV